uniref:Uncharacterized protein n=1 Tax=Panagrolaimus davidi TaxID=227884 RepID=A0A914PZQ6_9BILA
MEEGPLKCIMCGKTRAKQRGVDMCLDKHRNEARDAIGEEANSEIVKVEERFLFSAVPDPLLPNGVLLKCKSKSDMQRPAHFLRVPPAYPQTPVGFYQKIFYESIYIGVYSHFAEVPPRNITEALNYWDEASDAYWKEISSSMSYEAPNNCQQDSSLSNLTLFKEQLLNLHESSNLQQWCDAANEIIGLYDLSDDKICQTIIQTVPHELISSEIILNIQAESHGELLQALKDYEFSMNCGKLFVGISSGEKMEPVKFESMFCKLNAETHSAEELKPFFAALAMEDNDTKRKNVLEYLSTHPGETYENAVTAVSKD